MNILLNYVFTKLLVKDASSREPFSQICILSNLHLVKYAFSETFSETFSEPFSEI